MPCRPAHYPRHCFPAEVIGHGHAVGLYFRFTLSFRDIENLLSSHGLEVHYETIVQWCLKFGQSYANALRRRQPRRGDKWHLDELFLTIGGNVHYLWRAVEQSNRMNAFDLSRAPVNFRSRSAS